MGLIIKDKIKMMMVGYPTVSDKYNITGGILSGTSPVHFGELVMFDGNGYYKKVASASAVSDIAGFVLATNVKLAKGFGDNEVLVNPQEAFNLVLGSSYLAIAIDVSNAEGADTAAKAAASIKPNAKVYVSLTNGTVYSATTTGLVELPDVVLTGTYELQGSTVVAEVLVK